MAFVIKQNDTRPKKVDQLVDNFGKPEVGPVDLTTATQVKFIMAPVAGGAAVVNAVGDIEDAEEGIVSYEWDEADTDTVGAYKGEWEITWADGGVETVPNSGYIDIQVTDDLG